MIKPSITIKGSLGDKIEVIITSTCENQGGINDLCLWIDETDKEWKVRSHSNLSAEKVSIRKNQSVKEFNEEMKNELS